MLWLTTLLYHNMSKHFSMLNIDCIYKMLQAKFVFLYTFSYEQLSSDLVSQLLTL